ncbi:hypothetical protein [Actibacterium lipolyticum]|uniref:DUF4785 domain-containing protein n=1 Tax=Actibacterium lipolyticum TaxID=1524263 RepID=A0A238JKB7_9RHOB|nr:hypothetical protein [Actibacterium lipolyticum]SMX31108.1 hypothetical protein COL8621_00281 [Actibacterium lipolyticum]
MKLLSPIALVLLANNAHAGDFVSDGFGLVPATAISEQRAAWAGLIVRPDGEIQQPPEDAETVLIFVGPKSLVAGVDDGHAVTLNFDRHGNFVADDLPVDFRLGPQRVTDPETRYGIGDVLFRPDPSAGVFLTGATIQERQSARATYRVTADLESIKLQNQPVEGQLSFETFATLSTAPLTDKFGNVANDGVSAKMTITHGDGAFTVLTPVVSDGSAQSKLLTRDIPDGGAMTTTLGLVASAATDLPVQPLGDLVPAELRLWAIPEIEAVAFRAGPILTDAGHLLNDGASVKVTVQGASGASATADGWLLDGTFQTFLTLDPKDGPFEVEFSTPLGTYHKRQSLRAAPGGMALEGAE